jgi:hypothetical protein
MPHAQCFVTIKTQVSGASGLMQGSHCTPLDGIHLFSSISATVGNPGQSNYAAANAALLELADQKGAQGVPVCAVGWGPWGGSGMATQDPRLQARLEKQGVLTPMCARCFSAQHSQ